MSPYRMITSHPWTTSERSEQFETFPQPGTFFALLMRSVVTGSFLVKSGMGEKTNNIDVKIFSTES